MTNWWLVHNSWWSPVRPVGLFQKLSWPFLKTPASLFSLTKSAPCFPGLLRMYCIDPQALVFMFNEPFYSQSPRKRRLPYFARMLILFLGKRVIYLYWSWHSVLFWLSCQQSLLPFKMWLNIDQPEITCRSWVLSCLKARNVVLVIMGGQSLLFDITYTFPKVVIST